MIMEIFFEVEGYNRYSVSNTGRVRNNTTGRILKPCISSCGHHVVGLRRNNVSKTIAVEKLVAERFLPNPYDHKYIEHKDGNKLNNDMENLRWIESIPRVRDTTNTRNKIVKTLTDLVTLIGSILDEVEKQ